MRGHGASVWTSDFESHCPRKWQTQRTQNCGFRDFCASQNRSNRTRFTRVNPQNSRILAAYQTAGRKWLILAQILAQILAHGRNGPWCICVLVPALERPQTLWSMSSAMRNSITDEGDAVIAQASKCSPCILFDVFASVQFFRDGASNSPRSDCT